MAKKRNPAKGGTQEAIEGTGPEKNPAVHALALRYAKERDKRMEANKEEKEAHNALLNEMKKQGLKIYEYGDLKVFLDTSEKCKVSTEAGKSSGGDDEGDE